MAVAKSSSARVKTALVQIPRWCQCTRHAGATDEYPQWRAHADNKIDFRNL